MSCDDTFFSTGEPENEDDGLEVESLGNLVTLLRNERNEHKQTTKAVEMLTAENTKLKVCIRPMHVFAFSSCVIESDVKNFEHVSVILSCNIFVAFLV